MEANHWSDGGTHYPLSDGYALEKADSKAFAIHATIYQTANPRFELNWETRLAGYAQVRDFCYWIMREGQRIGGVVMRPNVIAWLFLEPPFTDTYQVLRRLKRLLLQWSDRSADINAVEVLPDQREHYHRLGFQLRAADRCMIRPTEAFDIKWEDDVVITEPRKEHEPEMSELMVEAVRQLGFGEMSQEGQTQNMARWFRQAGEELMRQASTLVFDKATNRLLGVCLIAPWQGWPVVYEVAVHPSAQGHGLATRMLQRAMTVLYGHYSLIRLNVAVKNAAESVYYNLGFLPGPELAYLYLSGRTNRTTDEKR